ncbi:hypothetical protein M8C21_016325 [Ambrosia artemisiifolia]|uniref:Uncharacterized protein n=1 Tax=Ambrosia artemisiifolia TaxID=4212 RepID=A0AAD5BVP5_AMBAR|nr:hypothetical protein M8C21_016325 [Ambrosia artemisiifolia]
MSDVLSIAADLGFSVAHPPSKERLQLEGRTEQEYWSILSQSINRSHPLCAQGYKHLKRIARVV